MTANTYSMSFTSAALLRRESLLVAELYDETGNWDVVRDRVLADNLLQTRTLNTSKRLFSEIVARLKCLKPPETALLLSGTLDEQGYLLWLAVCRRYRFIYDFAVAVVREKFLRMDYRLAPEDYGAFFNAKAQQHPEVDRVARATFQKQRQFLFKMMREAGILSPDHQILPALLSHPLVSAIDRADLAIFPVADLDIVNRTS